MSSGSTIPRSRGATDADRDLAAQALMKYGVSGWPAHFLGAFISDVPGAPDFFHKKVPAETGIGWYLRYLYEIGELGPGKRSSPLRCPWINGVS